MPRKSVSMVIIAVLLLSVSMAAAARVPAAVAPDCNTTCGNVKVPYPFGMGPRHCYRQPGFKLICDHRSTPPRLLLGDSGEFEVADIFLENNTMRVRSSHGLNVSTSTGRGRWSLGGDRVGVQPPPYVLLPDFNEFILTGCNVQATLVRDGSIVSGCASFCSATNDGELVTGTFAPNGTICSNIGCCQSTIPIDDATYDVRIRRLDLDDGGPRPKVDAAAGGDLPLNVIIAETGWLSQDIASYLNNPEHSPRPKAGLRRVPVILQWAVPHGAATTDLDTRACPGDAARSICKSTNSECRDEAYYTLRGYSCQCKEGYQGNPYLTGGCQDIKECDRKEEHGCFGDCQELPGKFSCRCPRGTYGNPKVRNGCVRPTVETGHNSGLIIGLSVASGPCILILVLGALLLIRDFEQRKVNMLRRKWFSQNRGQLLKQLVSHRTDIAERMIIPLGELEKATNNFDQARKVGGGGHGTVYKGILSDLHVVAIKKSKIVVKREIDEFINEVAILSQVIHKNIVKLHGCCLETEVPLLAYEFISNGTLNDHLHIEALNSLPWRDRLRIASEIGKALAYLHSGISAPVLHRDIKPSNILLDDALTAKVSDFGASRYILMDQTGVTTTLVQGTRGYLDPMYYYTGRLSDKSDVYSFGVLLIELLTRKKPTLYVSSEGDGLAAHFATLFAEGNLLKIVDPQVVKEGGREVEEAAALAVSCIKLRGEERPTMRQVEMALEALVAPGEHAIEDLAAKTDEEKHVALSYPSASRRSNIEDPSRCYSLEEEFMFSARYPR
ncbi:hypothetical protein VPH35_099614 [Triticum aestivum]|nr:wall-associated receptor kinase 3-like [Triticum aestivum]